MSKGGGIIPNGDFFSLPGGYVANYVWASKLVKGIILDSGCGYGYGSDFLAKEVGEYVIAVDTDSKAIKFAQRNYRKENLGFAFMDINNVGMPQKVLDAVVGFEVLEHLNNPRQYLQEVARMLKPRGHFLISTPNRNFTQRFYIDNKSINYLHVKEYYPGEIERLLSEFFEIKGIYRHFHPDVFSEETDEIVRRRYSLEMKIPIKIRESLPDSLKRLWRTCLGDSDQNEYCSRYKEFRIERVPTVKKIDFNYPTQLYDCVSLEFC